MTISTRKRVLGGLVAASMFVALAGCASAPEETEATEEATSDVVEGFKPCLVSDDGGFNDKSFNQSALEGMQKAADELGVDMIEVESASANDYAPNLENLVAEGCTFIVAVGFKLSADTITSATANPELNYAIIDDWADNTGATDKDGKPTGDQVTDAPNIKPLMFDTVQAAYLGGYAAAAWSAQTGVNKVGTVGGIPIPPVTIFMDGYVDGVAKYNEDKGANVETVGWDVASQQGSMTGGFDANDTAKQAMQGVLDQGVDVLLPVGGPIYQSARDAIADSGSDTVILGVDSDLAVKDPDRRRHRARVDPEAHRQCRLRGHPGRRDGRLRRRAVRRHTRERGRRPFGLRRVRVAASRRSARRARSSAGADHLGRARGDLAQLSVVGSTASTAAGPDASHRTGRGSFRR